MSADAPWAYDATVGETAWGRLERAHVHLIVKVAAAPRVPGHAYAVPWEGRQMTEPRGVILDLDGLLIDSEQWAWEAHNAVLSGYTLPALALDEVQQLVGLQGDDEWRAFTAIRPLPDLAREEYGRRVRDAFIGLRAARLAPQPGVGELLAAVCTLDLRLGLASNSSLASIEAALEGLGIADRFMAVASGLEPERGKPDPAVYLLALDRLGLRPDEAIAVEDSQAGLRAALAAGLYCVVVPGPITAALDLGAAHRRFDDLHGVAAWLPAFVATRRAVSCDRREV